jgi:hypothetical protein
MKRFNFLLLTVFIISHAIGADYAEINKEVIKKIRRDFISLSVDAGIKVVKLQELTDNPHAIRVERIRYTFPDDVNDFLEKYSFLNLKFSPEFVVALWPMLNTERDELAFALLFKYISDHQVDVHKMEVDSGFPFSEGYRRNTWENTKEEKIKVLKKNSVYFFNALKQTKGLVYDFDLLKK